MTGINLLENLKGEFLIPTLSSPLTLIISDDYTSPHNLEDFWKEVEAVGHSNKNHIL